MDALAIFNSLEAVLWVTIGITVFRRTRGHGRYQRLGLIASIWFILFGVSDVFEVFSGAWWRPWPLLALKVMCVIALIGCGITYRRLRTPVSAGRSE